MTNVSGISDIGFYQGEYNNPLLKIPVEVPPGAMSGLGTMIGNNLATMVLFGGFVYFFRNTKSGQTLIKELNKELDIKIPILTKNPIRRKI